MKKILLCLFILFFVVGIVYAADEVKTVNSVLDSSIKTVMGKAGADIKTMCGKDYNDGDVTAYCTTCTGTSDADIACEDFEGSGECDNDGNPDEADVCRCANGWTVVEDAATFTFDATHASGFSCADKDSHALEVVKTTDNGTTYAKKTWTDTDNAYIQFYMVVKTGIRTNNNTRIAVLLSDGNGALYLVLKEASGASSLYIIYHNGSGTTTGSEQTISVGTWYRIRLTWKKSTDSNGVVKFEVDDTVVTNVTDNGSTYDTDEFRFGSSGADTDAYTIQYDNLKIDDDTMPGGCS